MADVFCVEDSECLNSGQCFSGGCVCRNLKYGDHCELLFGQDDDAFMPLFWFYDAFTLLLFSGLMLMNCYLLYHQYKRGRSLLQMSFVGSISLFVCNLLRLVYYIIDPHNIRLLFPRVLEELIFTIPLLCVALASSMILNFWVELQLRTGLAKFGNLKRFPKVVLVIISVIFVFLVGSLLWRSLDANSPAFYLYNGLIALFVLFFFVATVVLGIRMRSILTSYAVDNDKFRTRSTFLNKVTRYVLFVSSGLAVALVSLVIFSALDPKNISYVGFEILFRIEETWVIANMLLFLEQRTGKKQPTSEKGTEGRTPTSGKSMDKMVENQFALNRTNSANGTNESVANYPETNMNANTANTTSTPTTTTTNSTQTQQSQTTSQQSQHSQTNRQQPQQITQEIEPTSNNAEPVNVVEQITVEPTNV